MQARYYDPVIGRFLSNDPVGWAGHAASGNAVQGFNRYTYVNNNPYKYTDPDGQFLFPLIRVVAPPPPIITTPNNGSSSLPPFMPSSDSATSSIVFNDNADAPKDKKRRYTGKDRDKILENADGDCEYCGEQLEPQAGSGKSFEADHIKPWVKGGETSEENGAASCRDCNRSKGKKELGEWNPPSPNERIEEIMQDLGIE